MVSEGFSLTFKNLPNPDKGPFLIEQIKRKKNIQSRKDFFGGGGLKAIWRNPDLTGIS